MFNRRNIYHTIFRKGRMKAVSRIRIPQPPFRPIRLHEVDVVRREALKSDDWWFVMHRRGTRRSTVGNDPLEARAVSKTQRKGTLPERTVLLELYKRGYREPADFTFQSSQEGGRMEIGGIVADFLFPQRKIVIQVQGPFHNAVLREAKDEEQDADLSEMGFAVLYITTEECLSPVKLEAWFRKYMDPQAVRGTNSRLFWSPDGLDEADEALLDSAWRVINRSSSFLQGSGIL